MTGKNIKGMRKGPSRSLRRKEGTPAWGEISGKTTPETWSGEGRADDTWRSPGLNIRTSQLTQPGVWGSKMMKCCLVWVQRNKSPLTEVTLHLEQVCRSICQGSDKSKCWNQVCLCGGLLQNPWLWTGHLLPAVGQQFLHFSQQICGVKHPGAIHVCNSLSDTHECTQREYQGSSCRKIIFSTLQLHWTLQELQKWPGILDKTGPRSPVCPSKTSWLPILLFYFALASIICSIWTAKNPPKTPGEWCFW